MPVGKWGEKRRTIAINAEHGNEEWAYEGFRKHVYIKNGNLGAQHH